MHKNLFQNPEYNFLFPSKKLEVLLRMNQSKFAVVVEFMLKPLKQATSCNFSGKLQEVPTAWENLRRTWTCLAFILVSNHSGKCCGGN